MQLVDMLATVHEETGQTYKPVKARALTAGMLDASLTGKALKVCICQGHYDFRHVRSVVSKTSD